MRPEPLNIRFMPNSLPFGTLHTGSGILAADSIVCESTRTTASIFDKPIDVLEKQSKIVNVNDILRQFLAFSMYIC